MQSGVSVNASCRPSCPVSASLSTKSACAALASARRQAIRSTVSSSTIRTWMRGFVMVEGRRDRCESGWPSRRPSWQLADGPVEVNQAPDVHDLPVIDRLGHVSGHAQIEAVDLVLLLLRRGVFVLWFSFLF